MVVLKWLGEAEGGGDRIWAVVRGAAVNQKGAVAGAYEAGLPVSFAGLFAGESRRRIALPGHPFERRRRWIKIRERQAATPI